jgi:hypothetical protein
VDKIIIHYLFLSSALKRHLSIICLNLTRLQPFQYVASRPLQSKFHRLLVVDHTWPVTRFGMMVQFSKNAVLCTHNPYQASSVYISSASSCLIIVAGEGFPWARRDYKASVYDPDRGAWHRDLILGYVSGISGLLGSPSLLRIGGTTSTVTGPRLPMTME